MKIELETEYDKAFVIVVLMFLIISVILLVVKFLL